MLVMLLPGNSHCRIFFKAFPRGGGAVKHVWLRLSATACRGKSTELLVTPVGFRDSRGGSEATKAELGHWTEQRCCTASLT